MNIERQTYGDQGTVDTTNKASTKFAVILSDRQIGDRTVAIVDTYLQLALQGTQHSAPTVETE